MPGRYQIYVSAEVGLMDPRAFHIMFRLKSAGFSLVWPQVLLSGTRGQGKDKELIKDSVAVLAFIDEKYKASEARREEIDSARFLGIPVLLYPGTESAEIAKVEEKVVVLPDDVEEAIRELKTALPYEKWAVAEPMSQRDTIDL